MVTALPDLFRPNESGPGVVSRDPSQYGKYKFVDGLLKKEIDDSTRAPEEIRRQESPLEQTSG